MRNGKRVVVVVPAFNEARLIGRVIAGIPAWVDAIVVVDDASVDGTGQAAEKTRDGRVAVVRHAHNRGVGGAIVTGYRWGIATSADALVVMAGDDQMDPKDLPRVVDPVLLGAADYVKGNRFVHAEVSRMPLERRWAGKALAALTRATTGLAIDDSQCGYTAISSNVAAALPLDELWTSYGYPNDLLGLLAAAGRRVQEVPVRPVYEDEQSGVRPWHALVVGGVIGRRYLKTRLTGYDSIARSIISSAQRRA